MEQVVHSFLDRHEETTKYAYSMPATCMCLRTETCLDNLRSVFLSLHGKKTLASHDLKRFRTSGPNTSSRYRLIVATTTCAHASRGYINGREAENMRLKGLLNAGMYGCCQGRQ